MKTFFRGRGVYLIVLRVTPQARQVPAVGPKQTIEMKLQFNIEFENGAI